MAEHYRNVSGGRAGKSSPRLRLLRAARRRMQPELTKLSSNDERCLNDDLYHLNALICTSAKVNRDAKKNEVILNGADGLNWKTAVRCDVIYLLPKAGFRESRGKVTGPRRVAIARKIAETLRLQMA